MTIGQRNFVGTHSLFVRCPWQVERGDESLDGWDTIDLLRGETLASREVVEVAVPPVGWAIA